MVLINRTRLTEWVNSLEWIDPKTKLTLIVRNGHDPGKNAEYVESTYFYVAISKYKNYTFNDLLTILDAAMITYNVANDKLKHEIVHIYKIPRKT
jgi:hypothetical protein